jgi:hypothetical protein
MANRAYPYRVLLRMVGHGPETDVTYEIKTTNASRAINKAKKEWAEDEGSDAKLVHAIDAARDPKKFRESK